MLLRCLESAIVPVEGIDFSEIDALLRCSRDDIPADSTARFHCGAAYHAHPDVKSPLTDIYQAPPDREPRDVSVYVYADNSPLCKPFDLDDTRFENGLYRALSPGETRDAMTGVLDLARRILELCEVGSFFLFADYLMGETVVMKTTPFGVRQHHLATAQLPSALSFRTMRVDAAAMRHLHAMRPLGSDWLHYVNLAQRINLLLHADFARDIEIEPAFAVLDHFVKGKSIICVDDGSQTAKVYMPLFDGNQLELRAIAVHDLQLDRVCKLSRNGTSVDAKLRNPKRLDAASRADVFDALLEIIENLDSQSTSHADIYEDAPAQAESASDAVIALNPIYLQDLYD